MLRGEAVCRERQEAIRQERGRPFIEETVCQGKEEAVHQGRRLFIDLQVGALFDVVGGKNNEFPNTEIQNST